MALQDPAGVAGILERVQGLAEVEEAVVQLGIDEPAWGQARVSNELKKRGIEVSPFGVRSIWLRGFPLRS